MDIREKFFTEGVVEHWNRLPRTEVESPSLEVSKKRVDVTLSETIYWAQWDLSKVELGILGYFFPQSY